MPNVKDVRSVAGKGFVLIIINVGFYERIGAGIKVKEKNTKRENIRDSRVTCFL